MHVLVPQRQQGRAGPVAVLVHANVTDRTSRLFQRVMVFLPVLLFSRPVPKQNPRCSETAVSCGKRFSGGHSHSSPCSCHVFAGDALVLQNNCLRDVDVCCNHVQALRPAQQLNMPS